MNARLGFLDGLRGLLALYVLLFHVSGMCFSFATAGASPAFARAYSILHYTLLDGGGYSVVAFLVVSGFSLALPLVRHPERLTNFSLTAFLKRRARRILPPYYAAMAFSLAVIFLFLHGTTTTIEGQIPLRLDMVLSHLFLYHNHLYDHSWYINGPHWSIAVEVQIYVVFAILLVPLWRDFGLKVTAVLAFVLGIGLELLLHPDFHHVKSAFWFLPVFLLGTLAAHQSFGAGRRYRLLWLVLGIGILALTTLHLELALIRSLALPKLPLWLTDCLYATGIACLLVACARGENFVKRFLTQRWLVRAGGFSYSLYLIHMPILDVLRNVVGGMARGEVALVLFASLAIGVSVLLALVFERYIERPFLNPPTKAE
jgi:peptidoglycan/LPS O-acetylase OafA/YrhL